MTQASIEQVREFLLLRDRLLTVGRCILVSREKNTEFLLRAGLSESNVNPEVAALTANHYVSGPDKEHQEPYDDVWVFGTDIDQFKVYIKLVVRRFQENQPLLKVLSFHEQERPLKFPFSVQAPE